MRTWCWVPSSSGHCHRLSLHQLDVPSHKDRSRCPRASSNPAAVTLSSTSLMPTQACEETLRSTSEARWLWPPPDCAQQPPTPTYTRTEQQGGHTQVVRLQLWGSLRTGACWTQRFRACCRLQLTGKALLNPRWWVSSALSCCSLST